MRHLQLEKLMKVIKKVAVVLGAISSMSAYSGGSVDLSLSNDAVRLGYDAAMVDSGAHFNVNGLHHIDDGDMAAVGFHVVGQRDASSPFYVGLGGQIMASQYNHKEKDKDNKKYFSVGLGIGGFMRYNFPFHEPLGISTHVYYSPRVITFADSKSMLDADIKIQYSVIPSAHAYVGYRYNATELEKLKDWSVIDDGLHVGVRLNF